MKEAQKNHKINSQFEIFQPNSKYHVNIDKNRSQIQQTVLFQSSALHPPTADDFSHTLCVIFTTRE
jgi:hypothetical protein